MEGTRATWTDERLDDLSSHVADGFNRLDEDLRSLRSDISGRFDTNERRFDALDRRIDSLQTTLIQFGAGLTVAFLATLISVLAINL